MPAHHLSKVTRDTGSSISPHLTAQSTKKEKVFSYCLPLTKPNQQFKELSSYSEKVTLSKDQKTALKEILSHPLKLSQGRLNLAPAASLYAFLIRKN